MRTRALVLALLLSVGCKEDRVCAPGATQTCACAGGHGAQACAADGARWEACACAAPPSATVLAPPPQATVATVPLVTQPLSAPAKAPPSAAPAASATKGEAEAKEPAGPQTYTLTIVSADIAPSKTDGHAWDVNDGAPDPVATIAVKGTGSGVVHSSKQENTTTPKWSQAGAVTIARGDRLHVSIVDKDLMNHDPIATWDVEFTGPGRKTLSAAGVNSFVFEVVRAQ